MRTIVRQGAGILPFIDDLARLRIGVFRAFPYLYEGSLDYERGYLATYARSTESLFVLALDGETIGVRFFTEREAHALRGGFDCCCFCAVERPADHPLRPEGHAPLDDFWRRRGYRHHPDLRTTFSWRDVGDAEETAKPMSFWLKEIR